jgi:CheY-like chemotaxis protein
MPWLLVADDDADSREALAAALRGQGYDVRTASDGAEVVWMLDEADPMPALVFLDAIMPRVTAVEALRVMRSRGRATRVPVVVMAEAQFEAASFAGSGATEVLIKPLSFERVLVTIARLCDLPPPAAHRARTHLSVASHAIDVLLQRLSALPPGPEWMRF